jgi:hypothetical protein
MLIEERSNISFTEKQRSENSPSSGAFGHKPRLKDVYLTCKMY